MLAAGPLQRAGGQGAAPPQEKGRAGLQRRLERGDLQPGVLTPGAPTPSKAAPSETVCLVTWPLGGPGKAMTQGTRADGALEWAEQGVTPVATDSDAVLRQLSAQPTLGPLHLQTGPVYKVDGWTCRAPKGNTCGCAGAWRCCRGRWGPSCPLSAVLPQPHGAEPLSSSGAADTTALKCGKFHRERCSTA